MFNFETNPSAMTGETIAAMIFAAIIFIAVPIVLAIIEYRVTKKTAHRAVCYVGDICKYCPSGGVFGFCGVAASGDLLRSFAPQQGNCYANTSKRIIQPPINRRLQANTVVLNRKGV